MGSLTILPDSGTSLLRVTRTLPLALHVESAAWAVQLGDELRLLINQPGASQTRQLRIRCRDAENAEFESVELLPPLPLVAAAAATAGTELLVTGANAGGRPMVFGATAHGAVAWQFELPDTSPVRWPVPGYAWQPVVVWQDAHGALEVASASSDGLACRRSIAVGAAPVDVAVGAAAVWVAWRTPAAIDLLEIREHDTRAHQVPAAHASDVAVCATDAEAAIAWTQGDQAFFTRLGPRGSRAAPTVTLDLGQARGGRLMVVAGPEALVWSQRADFVGNESPQWLSSLLLPGRSALTIDGLVHAVAWWGDRVAVVGSAEVCFLQRHSG